MAKCYVCGRSGLFFKVNKNGRCESCELIWQKKAEAERKAKADAERKLFSLQQLFYGKSAKSLLPTKDIIEGINLYCAPRLYDIQSAQDHLNTTDNPKRFYNDLKIIRIRLSQLQEVENIDPSIFTSEKPSEAFENIRLQLPEVEATMWERCYQKYLSDADRLKTERGRQNKIAAYFELVKEYEALVGDPTRALFSRQRKEHNLE